MKHIKYASYVIRHKWFVFLAAYKLGIPWLGIIHDMSKLRPSEWWPYAEYFYGGPHKPWAGVGGYEKYFYFDLAWRTSQEGVQQAFDRAWLEHIHRNKHHWQYWVLREDDDGTKILPMPDRYRREMLADWRGAGRAQGYGDNTREWYRNNRHKMQLHPDTRTWIEAELEVGE